MVENQSPALLLVAGLPASGKTWFARAIANRLNALHINSDTVRAELGLRGQYGDAAKRKVYETMFEKGKTALREGRIVVVDSTFYKASLREPWLELAARLKAPCHIFEIVIPETVALERLTHPRPDSEADQQVYRQLKTAWEPIAQPHVALDSSILKTEAMIEAALSFLSDKKEQ
jgi:predicted kinase